MLLKNQAGISNWTMARSRLCFDTVKAHGKIPGEDGFTLVEVLVVVTILFIVFALTMPIHSPAKNKSKLIICLSNQKQNALGFIMWNGDHGDKFPWEVPATNSGAKEPTEAGNIAPDFQLLTNYVRAAITFVCPSDNLKIVTSNLNQITAQNISYFLALNAATNPASAILTGDRHLAFSNAAVKPGLATWRAGEKVRWTSELHKNPKTPVGVLSFHDGHCEALKDSRLNEIFVGQGLSSGRLVVP